MRWRRTVSSAENAKQQLFTDRGSVELAGKVCAPVAGKPGYGK